MKSFIKKLGALVLLSCFASCGKDALRTYDAQQQLNAVEDVNDPFLLSSIIKQTTLFYQAWPSVVCLAGPFQAYIGADHVMCSVRN